MKKKKDTKQRCFAICFGLVILFVAGLCVPAAAAEPIGITFDSTWVSRYMWRGYDIFDDHAAFQPSVNWDIADTGWSLNVWGSMPCGTGSNINVLTELDYTVQYAWSMFQDQQYAMDFCAYYMYMDYPKANKYSDVHEIAFGVSMPNLWTLGGNALVPSYSAAWNGPVESGLGYDVAGWFHTFGLDYEVPVTCPITGQEQALQMCWNIVYNDGAYGADHDWSHTEFGISTSFDIGSLTLTPFVKYQISMDESVNTDKDELWSGLSASFSF